MRIMYVFAGNNGTGKSSYRGMLKDGLLSDIDIDSDAIERKLKAQGVENPLKKAGRTAINQVKECINKGVSFSIETTLSSKLSLKQIRNAKQSGFKVIMYYLYLDDVNLNMIRIAFRHQQGGHSIPDEDVIRRQSRSFNNLLRIKDELDKLYVLDNSSSETRLVATLNNGVADYIELNEITRML